MTETTAPTWLPQHDPLATADPDADIHEWLAGWRRRAGMRVDVVPLAGLRGWHQDADTGVLAHGSGRFFRVEGLSVEVPGAAVPRWDQPVLHQPEVGILGLLARRDGDTLRVLVQAKAEPGNQDGHQIAPTVQATRSNWTGVHGGRPVPFLHHFRDPDPRRVLVDVRQSEHGSWFLRKRNRNMVVLTDEDIVPPPGFRWLSLAQLHRLLRHDDLVNMDTRTVLSCLPAELTARAAGPAQDAFTAALRRSCRPGTGSRHRTGELLHWITDVRSRTEVGADRTALRGRAAWHLGEVSLRHDSGLFFEVIGVDVDAEGREVASWSQPMLRPCGQGVVAFLATRLDGVLHVLAHARVEAGFVDVVELAPTVQCTPATLDYLPAAARPPFLDQVLGAPPERVRFRAVLSEEGGRLYRARSSYLVVETDDVDLESDQYRWVTLHQVSELLRHSNYVNVSARSLVACLRGLLDAG
ncbi:NDP-hexose 2,3-dehydratase family protein [Micromonospora chalcea]